MVNSTAPLLHVQESCATITLNRPAHRNRLQSTDLQVMLSHIAQIRADERVRLLLLRANTAGQTRPVFSAGFHLGELGPGGVVDQFALVADAVAALPCLSICILNGSVYGGATDIALACDFRLAQRGIELKMPAAAIGLHYYPSGIDRFVRKLGVTAAKRLFLTAQVVNDAWLEKVGYVDELCDAGALDDRVRVWCDDILSLAPLAVREMKQSIQLLDVSPLSQQMQESYRRCLHSEDFMQALQAIAAGRDPKFSST